MKPLKLRRIGNDKDRYLVTTVRNQGLFDHMACVTELITGERFFTPPNVVRIYVPEMPSPLLTLDLLIIKDRPLPLVCLGVDRHHSKRGREGERLQFNLVDLNAPSPLPPSLSAVGSLVRPSRLSLNSSEVAKSDLIEMGK
ncbi:unnamed protein product [Calicophoron daubneyi]|uniref:Uncharacterized protein n=1 Tax=Calicophoron daubneyi TaxID=300641 RepID=A0AAV2TSR3_CALDB